MNNLSKIIDHTLLKPEATENDIKTLCLEAKKYDFYAICINPTYVRFAKEQLRDSNIKLATVIGFPLGSTTKEVKAYEAEKAIRDGANELDMVINIGALKNKDYELVKNDIEAVVNVSNGKALVKVIIETCLLTDEEKKIACKIAKDAGADFVKTSTGFSNGGATVKDVRLMRETVGNNIGVKASGSIREYEKAKEMIEAGATRIGSSASIKIIE